MTTIRKMRGLGPSLPLFGVQFCCEGKIKQRIETIMILALRSLELALKPYFPPLIKTWYKISYLNGEFTGGVN